jgi:hypothetical protein
MDCRRQLLSFGGPVDDVVERLAIGRSMPTRSAIREISAIRQPRKLETPK